MNIDSATVVLFSREDVLDRHASAGDIAHGSLTLTPSASEAVSATGRYSSRNRAHFSDLDQSRCIVAGRNALELADNSPLLTTLQPSLRLMVRQSLWFVAFLEHRLRRTLRNGPWIVRDEAGSWIRAENHHALLRTLLPRIWKSGLGHSTSGGRPPFPSIYRWLMRATARHASRKGGLWVAAVTQKLRSGLRQAVHDAGARLVVIQPTTGSWRDYRQLPWKASASTLLRVPPLQDEDSRVLQVVETLRLFGATVQDRHLAYAWSLYVPYIAKILPTMLAISDEGSHLLKSMGVSATFGFEANSWLSSALNEAAGRAGIQRIVLNHNSHPPTGNPTADNILSTLFRQRTVNPLVDAAGIWSPFAMEWLSGSSKCQGKRVKCQPVQLDYPAPDNQGVGPRPFRILHAGNYQNWSDYFPWVSETSEEFLRGMEQLNEAVAGMEGVELIFRVRPKREVDAPTLRTRLKAHTNVSVCDTEEDFLRQLAACDLLIAHFSTTVEQALQMGKPVLLWGNTQRYRQFDGSETLPDTQSRSVVYVVRHKHDLPAMLAAIRDAHRGRPLTQAETAPYRHPPGTPSLTQWVGELLNPAGNS